MTCRIHSIFLFSNLTVELEPCSNSWSIFQQRAIRLQPDQLFPSFWSKEFFHSLKDKASQDQGWKGFNANCKLFALNVTIETCWKLNYCFWKYMKKSFGLNSKSPLIRIKMISRPQSLKSQVLLANVGQILSLKKEVKIFKRMLSYQSIYYKFF